MKVRYAAVLAAIVVAAGPAGSASAGTKVAGRLAGPGVGDPWVVSVGDSFISGEAGRWAGNSNELVDRTDALGPTAYFDNAANTAERIPGCHRSRSAPIHIGGGVRSENLACSGATTSTQLVPFKPGLDFHHDPVIGTKGQALLLQEFATAHNVTMVAVSIGGNDFGFGAAVVECVTDFLRPPPLADHCHDDPLLTGKVAPAFVAARVAEIVRAYRNVRTAMTRAGYTDAQYTVMVQNYPMPLPAPAATRMRYPETYARQTVGGCGMYNDDIDWALSTFLGTLNRAVTRAVTDSGLTNIKVMDVTTALSGRRLCETTVHLLDDTDLASGRAPGAEDQLEWVSQIKIVSAPPHQLQEALHPNYWAQLALRSCLRQAYQGGQPVAGTCARAGKGRNARGEPLMQLTGSAAQP